MKIYIGTSRSIGEKCRTWARENLPEGCTIVETPEECDVFISVLYPEILSAAFIVNKFCVNFHPGILPDYRGSGACTWVIVNGEKESGVTLHVIDKGIDTGPIIDIRKFAIEETDTAASVFSKMEVAIYTLFQIWFRRIVGADHVFNVMMQPREGHTYYKKDLEKLKDVSRIVRALTFTGKENAFYIDAAGDKHELDYYEPV